MKREKIFFVTQYFYPEEFKGNDIAFDLAKRGVEVTVLTGIPNYPRGCYLKSYGLFQRRKEIVNGVKVIRVPQIPRGSNSIQLAFNYLSFAIIASVFAFFHCLFHKYDCCFIQQLSPVTMALPGVVFKKIMRKPVYTWVLDLWPESLVSAGGINNEYILSFFEYVVKIIYRNSDKILISSKGFESSILGKGKFGDKIVYYPNWVEDVFVNCGKKDTPDLPRGFRIMFAGNIGEAQDFDHIIEAAKLLKAQDDIKFIIIGDGRKKVWVDEQILNYQLRGIVYMLGRYPIDYMPSFFAKADVMLVSLKNELIFNLTVPAKIQAYMSMKKPILAMMNGEGASLIEDAKCGLSVCAESPEDLVLAIKKLKSLSREERIELGENGKKYCDKHFNKEHSLNYLYELMFKQ